MFTFHTNATVTRETEKAWGIEPVQYSGIVWLPKSQCTVTRQGDENVIRGKYFMRFVDRGVDINDEVLDMIEFMVEYDMNKAGLIIEVPDWLVHKKDLVRLFNK